MKLRDLIVLGLLGSLLVSCNGLLVSETSTPTTTTIATETVATPLPTPLPSPLATPTAELRTLTVCAGSEPSELFLYNDLTYIKKAILSVIYDGPVDMVNYDYQPVILTKLPSLADGDAVIEPVQVQEGDRVVDNTGAFTALQPGVVVRPAGCKTSGCAIPYESGALQMDRMRAIFHVRPGVEWADGTSLTAADSVFSYKIATDPETLYGNNGLISASVQSAAGTADYTALDDLTAQWTGLPGFLDPNYQTNFFIPLPEHQLSAYTTAQLMEANEVLYSPLGWGPYRVTGWDQGQQITLEPNPHYFRAVEGLPYYNRLVIRFIGQDIESNLAALSSGQCDMLLQDALTAAPTTSMTDMLNAGKARLYLDPQPVFEHLTFDVAPADPALPAFFSDANMRRAVAACVDRTALTDAIYAGLVPPLDLPLPSDHPLLNGADLTYPYDAAAGAALLETLGWKDTDGDTIREAHGVTGVPDGTLLRFTLTTTDAPRRVQVSGLIASQLKTCGMDVTVAQSAARDLLAQNADAALSGRHFDLAELSSPMSVDTLCALAATDRISSEANGWSGTNFGGYSNSDLDAACAEVKVSLPGTQENITSSQTAVRLFSEGLPVFPLFYDTGFTLARPDLAGILTGFGQVSELQNIESFRPGP